MVSTSVKINTVTNTPDKAGWNKHAQYAHRQKNDNATERMSCVQD